MNKQQALEAIVRKVRRWEEPHREVRLADPDAVAAEMFRCAGELETALRKVGAGEEVRDRQVRYLLGTVAAACLYLMTDEVDVVEVSDAAPSPAPSPQAGGIVALPLITVASYNPTPVNGVPLPLVAEMIHNERKGRRA